MNKKADHWIVRFEWTGYDLCEDGQYRSREEQGTTGGTRLKRYKTVGWAMRKIRTYRAPWWGQFTAIAVFV